jgi:hypothetical protein
MNDNDILSFFNGFISSEEYTLKSVLNDIRFVKSEAMKEPDELLYLKKIDEGFNRIARKIRRNMEKKGVN